MENRISLKIDLRSGVIEIDAPAESFEEAIAQTRTLTASLDFSDTMEPAPKTAGGPAASLEQDATPSVSTRQSLPPRKSKASKASAARPGRLGSFDEVKGLLTEPQEIELRKFFVEKAPSEQSHQALVAIVKGEQLLSRRGFSYNEIYTLMRLGGVKGLPKALDVVLQRLVQDQMIVRETDGFVAKFIGRDFVEQELPKNT
jgi:hypothetical protein